MPCVVTCRCGKSIQKFNKLNADQIDTFDCPKCPGMPHDEKAAPVAPKEQNNPFARAPRKKQPKAEAKAEEPSADQSAE